MAVNAMNMCQANKNCVEKEEPEDHWSCITHQSAEDMLNSVIFRKRSLKILNMSDLEQGQ